MTGEQEKSRRRRVAVVADDFTGAGDSGVFFATTGLRTALVFDNASIGGTFRNHDAVALSTESRFLSPDAAAEAVTKAVGTCREAGAEVFYKKIDSTLRGNVEAETNAAILAGGYDAALLCPAMPKTGRTVNDGVLHVKGVPVSETELGRDPFNPVPTSRISGLLSASRPGGIPLDIVRRGAEAAADLAKRLVAEGCGILVADAETDDDLATLGAVLRRGGIHLLPVGAGGLAEAFVEKTERLEPLPSSGRLLAIVGSLTATSREQAARAEADGNFAVFEIDMNKALSRPDETIRRLLDEMDAAGDKNVLVTSALSAIEKKDGDAAREEGLRVARLFGRIGREACSRMKCSRLYVTGGSTAAAAAEALGIGTVTLEREIFPGVVQSACRSEHAPVRWFITKAGGFGGPDLLTRI